MCSVFVIYLDIIASGGSRGNSTNVRMVYFVSTINGIFNYDEIH